MDPTVGTSGRRHYRTALTFALGLIVGAAAGDWRRPAQAQIPNAGQQRLEANQGIQQLNATMSEVLTVLRTGTLKVRVVETDKSPSGSPLRTLPDQSGQKPSSPAPAASATPSGSPTGGGSQR
ncbi:MAG: hypothetical protein HY718_14910 [Planctomycetes bacterium]|nr:hypothetical protein [Planctomycetota bacterium]